MKHLIGTPIDWSLERFKNHKERRLLITDPDWQRNAVWSNKRQSALIDSILMGVPIPSIYLLKKIDKNKSTIYHVIDGKQRIEAVLSYFKGDFPISDSTEIYNKEIKRKRFEELEKHLQNNLLGKTMVCFELTDPDEELLYEIFKRINTKGMSLNIMEVRNGIYPGPLTKLIKDLADDERFNKLLPKELSDETRQFKKRMYDRKCVLRFLAFYQNGWDTEGTSLRKFIDDFYKEFQTEPKLSEEKASEYREAFYKALEACEIVFGKMPFKLNKQNQNINLGYFQYITVCFKDYTLDQIKQKSYAIKHEHEALMKQKVHKVNPEKDIVKTWAEIISKHDSNATHVRYVFNTWSQKLKEIMNNTTLLGWHNA